MTYNFLAQPASYIVAGHHMMMLLHAYYMHGTVICMLSYRRDRVLIISRGWRARISLRETAPQCSKVTCIPSHFRETFATSYDLERRDRHILSRA